MCWLPLTTTRGTQTYVLVTSDNHKGNTDICVGIQSQWEHSNLLATSDNHKGNTDIIMCWLPLTTTRGTQTCVGYL